MIRLCFFIFMILNIAHCIESNKLTIKESYDSIMQNNEGLKAQKLNVDVMDRLSLASKLTYLPQIDLNAFYLHLGEKIQLDLTSGLTDQEKADLNQAQAVACNQTIPNNPLAQMCAPLTTLNTPITLMERNAVAGVLNILYPLYAGGARYYGNKLSSIALKDSKEGLKLKELAIFEQIIEIYYTLLLSNESVETLKANKEGAQQHYDNAQKLHKLGQIAPLELINSQMALDRATNALNTAQNIKDIAQLAFDSALRTPKDSISLPVSKLEISEDMVLKPQEYYVDSAINNYPALKIAKNKIESTKYQHRLQIGSFIPKIGVFGTFMVTDNQSKLEQMMPTWYLGVGATWSLLSPNARIPKLQASKIMQLQASALELQALQDMELLVKKTYKQVLNYKQEVSNLDSSIELAKENLRLQEKAYMQGMATNTQVTDARNALLDVSLEQKNAIYKTIIAFAKLQALSATPEEFFRVYK